MEHLVATSPSQSTVVNGIEHVVFRDPTADQSSRKYFCRLKITAVAENPYPRYRRRELTNPPDFAEN
jgi:hypothetical protein